MIAYCGLDCEKCDAYLATINDDQALRQKTAKLWSELNHAPILPEHIIPGFLLFFYPFSERMMFLSKTEPNFMEHLKPLLPAGGDASELEEAAQALAGLSPEDRDLLAAVQESPYRLTTLEQFREFPANTEYFILEPNIRKVEDVGWRYLAQHLDILLPPELLDAIDPVPFGNHAMQEEQGCFTSKGYLTLSGDEWEYERPRERQTEKKPSIKERLEQSRKECANQSKAQPHREKPAPER